MLQQPEYELGLTATRCSRHDTRERGTELGETLAHLRLHHLYEATPRWNRAFVRNKQQQQQSLYAIFIFYFLFFAQHAKKSMVKNTPNSLSIHFALFL